MIDSHSCAVVKCICCQTGHLACPVDARLQTLSAFVNVASEKEEEEQGLSSSSPEHSMHRLADYKLW